MTCPTCGEHRSSVLETRQDRSSGVIRRRRRCFNGHVYFTNEVIEMIAKITRRQERFARAAERRRERWVRDLRIVMHVRAGKRKSVVAKMFDIAPTTVTHVIGKYAPELKRSAKHGQR